MKAYIYYNKVDRSFVIATNIKAVSDLSGVSYTKIYQWFRNGKTLYEDTLQLCFYGEVIKGKQRVNGKEKNSKFIIKTEIPVDKKKEFVDLFDKLYE